MLIHHFTSNWVNILILKLFQIFLSDILCTFMFSPKGDVHIHVATDTSNRRYVWVGFHVNSLTLSFSWKFNNYVKSVEQLHVIIKIKNILTCIKYFKIKKLSQGKCRAISLLLPSFRVACFT